MKNTFRFISLVLSFALLFGTVTVPTHADGGLKGSEEIPYTEHNTTVAASSYDSALTVYTEDEAAAAGVPAGYSDYVIKVAPKSNGAYGGLCPAVGVKGATLGTRLHRAVGDTEGGVDGPVGVNGSRWAS